MTPDSRRIRRLVFWNRFWLGLVLCYSLVIGFNALYEHVLSHFTRLEINWTSKTDPKFASLVLSSSQGGPFIITHLATSPSGEPDTATAAIAILPSPLFMRGPKGHADISLQEMSRLKWVTSDGERAAPPKAGEPVTAIYYEEKKVTTPF